jgi:hypothetical protein
VKIALVDSHLQSMQRPRWNDSSILNKYGGVENADILKAHHKGKVGNISRSYKELTARSTGKHYSYYTQSYESFILVLEVPKHHAADLNLIGK